MINRSIIRVLIAIVVISCGSKSDNQKTDKIQKPFTLNENVYDDIDLFKLQGIKKIRYPKKFPYIKIEETESLKRVIYKQSFTDSVIREYKKEGEQWLTVYEERNDTGYNKYYEYITPKEIVQLGYNGTYEHTDYYLHDVSLISPNDHVIYILGNEPKTYEKPDLKLLDQYKSKAVDLLTYKYEIKAGILKVYTHRQGIKRPDQYSDISCYEIGDHSRFWQQFFYGKPVTCNY